MDIWSLLQGLTDFNAKSLIKKIFNFVGYRLVEKLAREGPKFKVTFETENKRIFMFAGL